MTLRIDEASDQYLDQTSAQEVVAHMRLKEVLRIGDKYRSHWLSHSRLVEGDLQLPSIHLVGSFLFPCTLEITNLDKEN